MRWKVCALILLTLITASCSGGAKKSLEIQEPWVTEAKVFEISSADLLVNGCICHTTLSPTTIIAYMTIQNNAGAADHLLKAESDTVSRIEFRRNDQIGDILNAAPIDTIAIPAHGKISLVSRNYSMILMGIKKDLLPGEKMKLSLFFEKAGKVDTTLEIRAR